MWVNNNNIYESIFYQCVFVGSLHKPKYIFIIVLIYNIVAAVAIE